MKKWTYVAVAGMLLGTAPVFTGCIDNDEPEGITILRQAKSELLRARASVEEANAASILADAALKEAQKAVVAAQARYYEALAAEQEAKAKKAEYEAELSNIQNEEERARLQALIDQLNAQQEERKRQAELAAAQLELDLMEVKTELAKQQALYEQALKDLALAKNTLTEAQKTHLEEWITEVDNAKEAVDQATATYEEKAEALTIAIKELDAAQSNELAKRQLARNVELAQREYDAAEKAYNVAKEAAEADFSSIEALEKEKADLDAQLEEIEKQLADLETEKTKLQTSTVAEAQKVEELKEAYEAIVGVWNEDGTLATPATKEYTLPEIKIQNRNIMGLPDYINDWGIAEDKFTYSDYLLALDEEKADNFKQKKTLNNYIKDVNSWTRTANDDAWTNNDILENQEDLAEINATIEEDKAKWQKAVNAFQGKVEIDATQMPGYENVKEAIDKYNAAVTAFIEAREAFETYGEENLYSWNIFNNATAEADKVHSEAIHANQEEFEASVNSAWEKVQQAEVNLNNANAAYKKALAEYELIEGTPTAEQEKALADAQAAVTTANENVNKAYTEYNNVWIKADQLRQNKDKLADANREVAYAAANEDFIKNQAGDAAITEKADELWDAVYGEEGAETKLEEAYNEALDTYYSYYKEMDLQHDNRYLLQNAYSFTDENWTWTPQQVDAVKLAEVYREELQSYIEHMSRQLFGIGNRLIELTVDEMKAEIEEYYMTNIKPDADFVPFKHVNCMLWNAYGSVGKAAYYQAQIDIAKATLENEEAIAALKAELNEHLADVNTIIAKAGEDAASAEWAYTQAEEALDAKFADVNKKMEDTEAMKYAVKPVIDKVTAAIETYLSYEDKEVTSLEDLKKKLNEEMEKAEGEMYEKETKLLKAQDREKKYANEEANAVTIAQEDLQEAENELQEAQDELQAANEALLAEIDRISETNEEVAE